MSQQIINTIFKFKRAEAAVWTSKNPVLERGEPGFEIDTGKLKIGNGTSDWNSLNYVGGSDDTAIDSKITEAFNNFVAQTSEDGSINTFKELVQYAEQHQNDYTSLNEKIEQKIWMCVWEESD
jgi:hypothetical protein